MDHFRINKILKKEIPQLNYKTQLIKTYGSSVTIREANIPELTALKKETYFSRLLKAVRNKPVDPETVPRLAPICEKVLTFKPLEIFYRDKFFYIFFCYDASSDSLFISESGYTDIDLRTLEHLS